MTGEEGRLEKWGDRHTCERDAAGNFARVRSDDGGHGGGIYCYFRISSGPMLNSIIR